VSPISDARGTGKRGEKGHHRTERVLQVTLTSLRGRADFCQLAICWDAQGRSRRGPGLNFVRSTARRTVPVVRDSAAPVRLGAAT